MSFAIMKIVPAEDGLSAEITLNSYEGVKKTFTSVGDHGRLEGYEPDVFMRYRYTSAVEMQRIASAILACIRAKMNSLDLVGGPELYGTVYVIIHLIRTTLNEEETDFESIILYTKVLLQMIPIALNSEYKKMCLDMLKFIQDKDVVGYTNLIKELTSAIPDLEVIKSTR